MRFVPAKTAQQQAALMLAGTRDQLVRTRTRLANAIRSHAAEFGLAKPIGTAQIAPLLERMLADTSLPELARELFAEIGRSTTSDIPRGPVALWRRHPDWSR